MNRFYKIIRAIMIALTKTVLPLKIVGNENLPKDGGYILCCNHTSMSDVIYMIADNKKMVHFMGKQELFKLKFMAYLYTKMGCFPVNRGKGDTSAIETSKQLASSGNVVGIFPEGTRNKKFGPPKQGKSGAVVIAQSVGVPIVPAAICRTGKFALFRKTVLRYGKPIEPSDLPDISEGRSAIKITLNKSMNDITKLWEQGIEN